MLQIDRDVMRIACSLGEKHQATGLEQLYAVAADGSIYSAVGKADRVDPPPTLQTRYSEEGADIVYHHTHPDDRALSPSDLGLIAHTGVKTVWAHAPLGASYGARLREGIAKDQYRTAVDRLHSYLCLEIVQRNGVALSEPSYEQFRDFATMLALERHGWIYCHLAWSDQTRRSVFNEMGGFFSLVDFLFSVTPAIPSR